MGNRHYGIKQLMELDGCTGCRFCVDICPAAAASADGRLSSPYRLDTLKCLLKDRSSFLSKWLGRRKLTSEKMKAFSDTVFRCTLCGNCEEICPVGIHLKDLWLSLRQDLVASEAYPNKIQMIRKHLEDNHNVFAENNDERSDWVEFMRNPPKSSLIKTQAEVVYFTGCVASFFPMAQKIPMALVDIFNAAGVDFTLLGSDEWCCGFPLLGAGLAEDTKALIAHNLEVVRHKEARKIVFACPSCYQMWREYYPAEFELQHATQFLHQIIMEGRLSFKEIKLSVTYHDPCDLGRGSRVFEPPREIIKSIPGIELIEMERHRENCLCCGGGGNLEMIDPDLASSISADKIESVMATGAEAVVTSCQQCVRTMTSYARKNKIRLKVMDITQLVRKAIGK